MKKLLVLSLAALMMLSLAACGNTKKEFFSKPIEGYTKDE